MQRHMPMGYRIVDGKAEIIPETARIVKIIFQDYLNGISTYRIARSLTAQGILNASHKPSWNHGSVGKILENQKYKGDGFYPPLIENEIFEQVQLRRREKAESLGRTAQPNSFANQSMLGGKLKCGICGQPYRKYVEHCNQPGEIARWKCRHYIHGNRVYCRNLFLTEEQIENAILTVINCIIAEPEMLEQTRPQRPKMKSAASEKLSRQIQICLETGQYTVDEIKALAFERAREQYRISDINDGAYQTEKLKAAVAGREPLREVDAALFQRIIRKIVVYEDGRLQFQLLNGLTIEADIS